MNAASSWLDTGGAEVAAIGADGCGGSCSESRGGGGGGDVVVVMELVNGWG